VERLLRIASPLGLYAEEYDPETGRHLGNFPQAFSHLAPIEAAREARGALTMDAYDAIITGTGAGGDALARHFAPSGKRVLLLERGDWLLRELPLTPACLHEERDPGGRVCASGRYLTVRHGSGHVGDEPRLPGPARQLLGRGHESLPDHRGGEAGAHRDSQRSTTQLPPAHAAGLTRGER
jgi:hypothetical protein